MRTPFLDLKEGSSSCPTFPDYADSNAVIAVQLAGLPILFGIIRNSA
jgi:hypothetical protein